MIKRFSGILDKDSKEQDVMPFNHVSAKNVRFTGDAAGLTCENIKGNILVPNASLPSGTNECNGSFFDSVRQRILWFNYNSNTNNGLYSYSINTGTITQLFRCGVNSATDILGLSLDYPVHSAAIVYRDSGEGDLFYWTNGYGRPMYCNLDTISSVTGMTSDMINAAKNSPIAPPSCEYQDNPNVTSNNLRKKMFRFCYRWVYENYEKSTFSPISKVPLPVDGYDPNTQNDPTLNNNILIEVTAGGEDYSAIEIAAQYNINDTWSDFVLIDKLDRDEYSISPNTTYDYYFFNDGAYPVIATDETDLYFSWIPDKANTLELLNGNVLIYSGIEDGYDKIAREDIDVIITTGSSAGQSTSEPSISYNFSGSDTIIVSIGSVINTGSVYHVEFNYQYFSVLPPIITGSKNVNYTTLVTDTQNDIVNGLSALIAGGALTCQNLGNGYLKIYINTGLLREIKDVVVYVNTAATGESQAGWKWSYNGRLGLIYFDERGKTNGVISFSSDSAIDDNDFSFVTPDFAVSGTTPLIPFVSASINHTPPTWAKSYQWVRANTLPKFLYWITNDYQSDSNYLYFCIQNLIYQKTQDTGFVPSYEFSKGDRVRVIAAYTGGNFAPYNTQLDFEILGVDTTKIMTSPASAGTFLKVAKPSTLPTAPYQTAMLIEIYTPAPILKDNQSLFWEWGEKYDIYESGGIRYHRGQTQDQDASQAALFQWFDGDVYYKNRSFYTTANNANTVTEFIMDANYSDYFESAVNSNGRGWVIEENAKQQYNGVLSRWGGQYQSGTNINRLNIFRPADFDEADRSKGDILRLKVRDRILRVFQDRGVGQYGIYSRFIQNNEGVSDLVTTNEIITSNNIQYYQGVFGLGGYPTNLCSSPTSDYFTDISTGRGIRLSNDGLTDLGELYNGKYYFPRFVTPYNKDLTRTNGAKAKVMAFFDTFDGDFHAILQGYSSTAAQHYSFNEKRNGYCCDSYDYVPEWALSANDVIFAWNGGNLYRHDSSAYCNFFGVQYNAEISIVFNDGLNIKKSWNAISEVANDTWACPLIYTNTMSYGTQRQETSIVKEEFKPLEGMPSAVIKRDANSRGGRINGGFMKGNFAVVKLRKENASNYVTLSEVICRVTESGRNDK